MPLEEKQPVSGVLVSGIGLSPEEDEKEALAIAAAELKRAGINPARLHFHIRKRSIDARRKNDIRIVYSVAAYFPEVQTVKPVSHGARRIMPLSEEPLSPTFGGEKLVRPPLVVGMGPAGLFAALLLAENGYCPVIIDRGDDVAGRMKRYREFVQSGVLDTESNIQFGAGGAGTFSDGKLLTRINDPYISWVLRRFCDFGAPEQILTEAKPHIGTDLLSGIIQKMLAHIESLGGTVRYRCRMDSFRRNAEGGLSVATSAGELDCGALILAPGHSARDTYAMLLAQGYELPVKSFSVGVRIEHLQEKIDRALYGDFAGHPKLGHAEYHLSDTTSGRGVYTFCMCPGGEVVAAASGEGGVVVNGMSNYARDGRNANSAVAVTVRPEDFDGTPMGAIAFQRTLERAAFLAGGGDYSAPFQTVGDFLSGGFGTLPSSVLPTYREGRVRAADMRKLLPSFVAGELERGIRSFDRTLPGFSAPDAILTGVETRTSAPVRILRGEDRTAAKNDLVYPCGEGAGYAGGITSSAVDGLRSALQLMSRFSPVR